MARSRKNSGLAATSTVNLAGSALTCPCHVCAFHNGVEEQDKVLLPFIKEGLEAGDRVMLVFAANKRAERIERLRQSGVDVEGAQRNGQLQIETWDDVYLRDGRFDADEMMGFVQDTINTGRQCGFPRTRGWANMEWALQDAPGVEQLALYESRLNFILPLYGDAGVCAYDTTRFPASVLEDVVRAHPHLLADGFVQENPYYVRPKLLVPELESRLA
jgi:hypothetical protein